MKWENVEQQILALAEHVLTEDELEDIFTVIQEYKLAPRRGVKAFHTLDGTFGIPKEDPMFAHQIGGFVDILNITPIEESWNELERALIYCRYFVNITDLSQTSRDFVRRSCDYVENTAKYLFSSLDSKADLKRPLGYTVNALKKAEYNLPKTFLEKLEDFNNIVYTAAKHEHKLPPGEHLYSIDEAFIIYFIAKKLGSALRELVELPPGFSLARHNP